MSFEVAGGMEGGRLEDVLANRLPAGLRKRASLEARGYKGCAWVPWPVAASLRIPDVIPWPWLINKWRGTEKRAQVPSPGLYLPALEG